MKSNPISEIKIRDNMYLAEINKIQNKINELGKNIILRERKINLGKSEVIRFDVYNNTFSERSFNKLQKIKNNFLNEKLEKNPILTKGIFSRNSISAGELTSFLDKKKEEINKYNNFVVQKIKEKNESDKILKESKDIDKSSNDNEFEAQSTKININPPSSTTSIKVSPELSESEVNARKSHSVVDDFSLRDNGAIPKLKPRENNNISTVNNLKDSRTIIKQNHIDNLKKAIDFDNMKFDKNEFIDKNNSIDKDLNSQKEYVERYIGLIASHFTLKESERKSMDKAIFSGIKISLKKEFEFLINMAKDNGYQLDNWVQRTADLDSALESINFIPEKYHSGNWAKMTANLDSALLSIDFIQEEKSSKDRPELSKSQANAREIYSVLKDLGLRDNGAIEKLKSRDKNNSGDLNNLKDSPTIIKQEHIDNLKKAIDFDGMQFDKDKPNYEQLNRQKEFLDTTIKLIASTSTLKKSERIIEGRGSLSDLKLELKREFQNLLTMANNNGY